MKDLRYLILGIVLGKGSIRLLASERTSGRRLRLHLRRRSGRWSRAKRSRCRLEMVSTVNDKVVRLPADRKRLAKSPFRRQLCWTTWPAVARYWETLQKQSIILTELNVGEQNPIICLASAWTYNMKSGWTTQTGQFKWKLKTVLLSYSPWSWKRALLFTSITQGFPPSFFLLFNSFYRSWCLVDWSESSLGSYR